MSDGTLDPVAFLVDFGVEVATSVHAGALRDDGPGADRLGMVEDGVAVIGPVGDEMGRPEALDKGESMGGIIGLSAGQEEADRPSERVDRDVPLRAQSASGTPQSLVFTPPF
jgi:hypothetical protein